MYLLAASGKSEECEVCTSAFTCCLMVICSRHHEKALLYGFGHFAWESHPGVVLGFDPQSQAASHFVWRGTSCSEVRGIITSCVALGCDDGARVLLRLNLTPRQNQSASKVRLDLGRLSNAQSCFVFFLRQY